MGSFALHVYPCLCELVGCLYSISVQNTKKGKEKRNGYEFFSLLTLLLLLNGTAYVLDKTLISREVHW